MVPLTAALTAPTTQIFAAALRGAAVRVRRADGSTRPLPSGRWLGAARGADISVLDRTVGPALDVGCGPGRIVAALTGRGAACLGVDIDPAAVQLTRDRGGLALRRSVFQQVPGIGRWQTVLLVDGNIGIGGDAVRLLRRTAALLGEGGRVLVELSSPGVGVTSAALRLEHLDGIGEWFRWADVAADAVADVAGPAGLTETDRWSAGDEDGRRRWFSALACSL